MGLSPEEKQRRREDEHVGYIMKHICDRGGDKSYVFISYKSDDWETVLHEIVYKLVKDYGLNVYFDGSFDFHNSAWIKQFPDNMGDYKCKGVIAFFDDSYATSYATLMELLYSQTKKAAMGKADPDGLPIVSIDLEKLTNITGKEGQKDTGLGVKNCEDNTYNINAKDELTLFARSFKELVKRNILVDAQYIWDDKDKLNAMTCSQIVREIKEYKKINENYYSCGMSLDGIVGSIKNACGAEVFSPLDKFEKVRVESGVKQRAESSSLDELKKDQVQHESDEKQQTESIPVQSGYKYTIFGKEYKAGKKKQGKLMFDAFEALIEHYPGCEEKLTQRTSVEKAENVKNPNTPESYPMYFRGCKAFEVNGQTYLVGTSYSLKDKLSEIKGMFKICGADLSEFVLDGEPLDKAAPDKSIKFVNGKEGSREILEEGERFEYRTDVGTVISNKAITFKYTYQGKDYTAKKLSEYMHDAFDLLAASYPDMIEAAADREDITFIARKNDVDNYILPANKLNYFVQKRKHSVGNSLYYVSNRYNQAQGIAQVEKLVQLCKADTFRLIEKPEPKKKSASKGNSSKFGIDNAVI